MKKLFSVVVLFALLLSCFAGCGEVAMPTETGATTEAAAILSAEELAVLAERRDIAESYMRHMATILWRAGESVDYFKGQGDLHIVEGRLYRGIPYAYAAGNDAVFLGFSQGEENGIYQISGLTMDLLGRNDDKIRRVGNDCSGSVLISWGQVATSFMSKNTQYMTPENGFLRVGEYKSSDTDNANSKAMCEENGVITMFEAYAQLQKADAVVRRTDSFGHVMMVTSVHVERNKKGNIDGNKSYVTLLHQTNSYLQKEAKEFDPEYGEDVYQTFGIDDKRFFFELFADGYLPITCLEFIDPNATINEPNVVDSIKEPTLDNLYEGEFIASRFISIVDVTVTDAAGQAVQTARAFGDRNSFFNFQLSEFVNYPTRIVGTLDVQALQSGTYTITYECELVTGERFTVRQFEFAVE